MRAGARPYAIVIGLDCFTGLQTARILADRDVPVIGIADNPGHFGCRTNVVEQVWAADTAGEELTQLLVARSAQFHQKPVLVPCTDMSVLRLSRNRDRLRSGYRLALPAPDTVEMLMDKTRFYTYAQQAGLPIPGTFFLHTRADAERAAPALTFPCIIKPPVRTPEWERQTKAKVFKVADAAEFLTTYDMCRTWADTLMVQEWIPGGDANLYSCNCYFDAAGEPLVTFIARKLRQWPPETGTSSLGEECRNDEVLEASVALFRGVGYHGLGYVEMKRDARTGRHYIIEPNIGRPTGRSAITEAGGVELLYTMYCDLIGSPLPANRQQQYRGVKWIYLRHDVQSAVAYWLRGELTLYDWWQSWRGKKAYAVFSWRDPVPFWGDLVQVAGKAGSRLRARGKGRAQPQPSTVR